METTSSVRAQLINFEGSVDMFSALRGFRRVLTGILVPSLNNLFIYYMEDGTDLLVAYYRFNHKPFTILKEIDLPPELVTAAVAYAQARHHLNMPGMIESYKQFVPASSE